MNLRYFLAMILRGQRRCIRNIQGLLDNIQLRFSLFINLVEYHSIYSKGLPYFCVAPSAQCKIGENFKMNNGLRFNPIGFPQPCTIYVGKNARLTIGNHVGISQASIICHYHIEIQDYVTIGGGVKIYDTDFHSKQPNDRRDFITDQKNKRMAKITIQNDAFIGAGSIILKGVTIGKGSIIGAGSIVTKSIPSFEIWAGNPAKFIKKISPYEDRCHSHRTQS